MFYVLVNPASRSGKGAKLWADLEPVMKESKCEYKVIFSKKAGQFIEIVRDLSNDVLGKNPDAMLNIIALGGDGTIDEVLQGVSDFKRTRIGYVPTGSSNDLARDLGLPKNPAECLKNIINCKSPYYMDLGILTYDNTSGELSRQHEASIMSKRFFDVSSGIGFDAAVCEEVLTAPMKSVLNKIGLGKLVYLTVAVKQIFSTKNISAKMILDDDKTISMKDFLFASFMIHRYEGGGFKFCPDADCTDGILDICSVSGLSPWAVIRALPKGMKGTHTKIKGIGIYKAKKIHIETSVPCWVHTDGEVTMKSDSITITCQKEMIQLLK